MQNTFLTCYAIIIYYLTMNMNQCSARIFNIVDRNSATPTISITNYYYPSDSSSSLRPIHSNKLLSRIHRTQKNKKRHNRRSISNAVIETARCEHPDLLDCDDYTTNTMSCMVTATGMPCCICSGKLKSLKKKRTWSLW